MAVRAGYQVMFVEGVAVASNQVPHTNNPAPLIGGPFGVEVDHRGLFYHGALVQLEIRR